MDTTMRAQVVLPSGPFVFLSVYISQRRHKTFFHSLVCTDLCNASSCFMSNDLIFKYNFVQILT
jgi:hypothetical protein